MSQKITQWILELKDKASAPLKRIADLAGAASKSTTKLGTCLKNISAIDIHAIGQSFQTLNRQIDTAVVPGIAFENQMAEVKAITGVTDKVLNKLGDSARKTAKIFGGDASSQLEAYKTVLSRLGPEISNKPAALKIMGDNIQILSKTMGGDAVGATNALTTSLLQFQTDLSDPIHAANEMTRMMNVMAASAKEGAAEVPQISQALEQSGAAASLAKVSFEEANTAIQMLATSGKYGSEAGEGLRNILLKLNSSDILPRKAQSAFKAYGVDLNVLKDNTLPLAARLKELQKVMHDSVAITAIFDVENVQAAEVLIRTADKQQALTDKITGTNVAAEQAAVIMDTYSERKKRWIARLDDAKISLFNLTKGFIPFVQGGFYLISMLANVKSAYQGLATGSKALRSIGLLPTTKALKALRLASFLTVPGFLSAGTAAGGSAVGLNIARVAVKGLSRAIYSIPAVGWVLAAISALVVLGTYLYNTSGVFRGTLYGIYNVAKLVLGKLYNGVIKPIGSAIVGAFTWMGNSIKKVFSSVFGWLGEQFIAFFGMIKKVIAKISSLEILKKLPGIEALRTAFSGDGFLGEVGLVFSSGMSKGQSEVAGKNKKSVSGGGNLSLDKLFISGGSGKSSTAKKPAEKTGGLIIGGGGGSKMISLTVNMKNYFNSSEQSPDEMANKVVRHINDRLRDHMVTFG